MPQLRRLSPRHTKGVWTLTLVVLAESVTFSNAVSFWSKFQHQSGDDSSNFFQTTTTSNSNSNNNRASSPYFAPLGKKQPPPEGSCDASAAASNENKPFGGSRTAAGGRSAAAGLLQQWAGRGSTAAGGATNARTDPAHCCQTCAGCLGVATTVAQLCRGGHGIHHGGGAAAVDAVLGATTPLDLPLNAWKVVFQFFLTALNVACWLIPLKSKHISENKLGLSLANAFSGGVFLSLAFGHLIPECIHGFDESYNEATPFLLVLGGYLLIFFVEKVAFDAHDILHEMEHSERAAAATTTTRGGGGGGGDDNVRGGHSHSHPNGDAPAVASSGRSAVILLGALAVHSILEMMALGLSNSFSDCALLTLSISLHQPAESIALLVAFLKSGLSHDQIIRFLSIFSCMGPIGVMLGMLVNEYAAPIVDSIMLAIVAGTFVYVGATEVIPEEWEDSTHKWKKFAALISGIVSILAITQYTMTLGH